MKKIKVFFFGSISEAAGRQEEIFETEGQLSELITVIEEKYPSIQGIKHQIAVNQEVNPDISEISDGDELAFLPPFAGG